MHLPLVAHVDRWVDRWALASQQQARRNAMVAATALRRRRAETREVEEFLAAHDVRRPAGPPERLTVPQ
jgi:hypothetical protein